MIVYLLLILTLFLAGFSLYMAAKSFGHGIPQLHRLLLAVSTGLFVFLFGTWVFLSVWLKYVFAICFAVMLLHSFTRRGGWPAPTALQKTADLLLAIIFTISSILYFTGTITRSYDIAHLSLPFKHGCYFVFQGGKGLPTNVFHYQLRGAVFAMDVVKLNSMGNRAKRIFSPKLEDYEIYGDTVYSPCTGLVTHTEDTNPDNIPPSMKRGPTNINHILIETDSMYVFMGHLKPGCVFVHAGDRVVAGQPIACCGNSGFSLEPHLHIQVHARTNSELPWYKEQQLLIKFDDNYYNLFEVININRR